MIQTGDRVAVGVSGGKDSISLLLALNRLKDFLPEKFEVEAVTISMGYGEFDLTPVKDLCRELKIPYTIEDTLIGRIIFEERKVKSPCSLCANMRRGALNNAAVRLGCNKVALAHHFDDVIETAIMNTIYEGNFKSFSPVTYLENKKINVIRPLIYTKEKDIKAFIKQAGITPVVNPCCANGKTKRQFVKDLLRDLSKENKHIKANIFGAVKRSGKEGWVE